MIAAVAVLAFSMAAFPPQAAPARRATASAPARASFEQLSQAAAQARNEMRDDEAIRLYREALKLRPGWQEGLWYVGALLYENKRYPEARDALRRFLTYDPGKGAGWALLGLSEFQTREYARALDHLQRAMTLGMDDRKVLAQSVWYTAAVLQTRFEKFDDSMGLLIAMVKAGQDATPLVEPIGLAALRLPVLPSEIPPDRRKLVQMAGRAALALESVRHDEAEQLFRTMIAEYPNEPGVHFLYGAFLMGVRADEGVREMRRELEIAPSSVPARLRLAEQYVQQEQVDEALPLAEEALRLAPRNALAHMMVGEVLVAKRDLAAGIQRLEAARELSPETVRIHWDLLRAYTSAGRAEDAKREKDEIEKLSRTSQ